MRRQREEPLLNGYFIYRISKKNILITLDIFDGAKNN